VSAEKIITALMRAHAPLLAVVPFTGGRIGPGPLAQGVTLPAIAYNLISNQHRNTLSGAEPFRFYRSRVQVTVLATSYAQQKDLIRLVFAACSNRRGVIAGCFNVSVLSDIEGPDMKNDDAGIFMQTIDFMVTFVT
jgi:hypothetical protein